MVEASSILIMKIISLMQSKISLLPQKTDYIIGSNLLANLHRIINLKANNFSSFLLLSDRTVFNLHGKRVITSLEKMGKSVTTSVISPGEDEKCLNSLSHIIEPFFRQEFNRNACLISFGGGVLTDLGGFLASILLRGISSIYIPTTLLSQVDAAIGGKTGVDFWLTKNFMLKNMIGTIRQPKMVISDVDTLATLPKKEILNGLGEMVKYWIGFGKPTLKHLGLCTNALHQREVVSKAIKTPARWPKDSWQVEELAKIISLCQHIKIEIVKKDPFDKLHIREKLNLGHTIGHAIEGVSNGKLSHGQTVAIGSVVAAKISVLKGLLNINTYKTIVKTIQQLGLPVSIRRIDTKQVVSMLKFDKKDGTFVLIKNIGQPIANVRVENNIIEKALMEVIS